ncbi:hypothetical protein J3E68DRAFT_408632 [Trichoderma sp. SZMC 28012]
MHVHALVHDMPVRTYSYIHASVHTRWLVLKMGWQPESDRVSIQAASHRHFLRAELWGKALEQKRVQELVVSS